LRDCGSTAVVNEECTEDGKFYKSLETLKILSSSRKLRLGISGERKVGLAATCRLNNLFTHRYVPDLRIARSSSGRTGEDLPVVLSKRRLRLIRRQYPCILQFLLGHLPRGKSGSLASRSCWRQAPGIRDIAVGMDERDLCHPKAEYPEMRKIALAHPVVRSALERILVF
jgi:hypothetical protein